MIGLTPVFWAACVPLAVWAYLLAGRGRFWTARERDDLNEAPDPAVWPSVVAVVPARDEADVVGRSVGSLLSQDYPGDFRVVLVDDGSSDGTAGLARAAAQALGREERLTVVTGAPLPSGWTGKLWAMAQGVARAAADDADAPEHVLLTDADIAHAPDNLRRLVARSQAGGLVMSSLMVRLHCATGPEKLLIPAFVFFFQMLYPFPLVNDARSKVSAAAGGCMLVRRAALDRAGGVAAIRSALIDDCTLGALMKRQGPIRLELGSRAWSLRPYTTVGEIGRMVSRSAYAQLDYSPWLLAGTLLGMSVTYLAPVAFAVFGPGWARLPGGLTWLAMVVAFAPTLKQYRLSPLWGLALPFVGAIYTAFTVQSAIDTWRGKGGVWKGRAQGSPACRRRARAGGGVVSVAAIAPPAAAALRSGKGEKDENFPVASFLLKPEHRAPILAFYRFARTGDDVSDHPTLPPHEKLAHLATMRATLAGDSDADPESLALRRVLEAKGLTPKHGLDLLEAFRRDVTKLRYDDWDDLIDYCGVSAMPVGRFVLDVHGEEREITWRASDALCAALQVINHLQDCGKDRRTLDRVYIPQDALAAAGIGVEALDAPAASPALRGVLAELAARTEELLFHSRPFAGLIGDGRLAYEVAVIQRLAEDLNRRLMTRDPLSQRVHHRPWEALGLAALAAVDRLGARR